MHGGCYCTYKGMAIRDYLLGSDYNSLAMRGSSNEFE